MAPTLAILFHERLEREAVQGTEITGQLVASNWRCSRGRDFDKSRDRGFFKEVRQHALIDLTDWCLGEFLRYQAYKASQGATIELFGREECVVCSLEETQDVVLRRLRQTI